PADQKAGCGVEGAAVQLRLISGDLDAGSVAGQVLWRSGAVQQYDLSSVASITAGTFVGALPAGPGAAQLRWTGGSGVPIQTAIASIPRGVDTVYFWDVSAQKYRSYVVGGPAMDQTYTVVDADDIVLVRVR